MTRFAIALALPVFLTACAGGKGSACESACSTLGAVELEACETAYTACTGVVLCEEGVSLRTRLSVT